MQAAVSGIAVSSVEAGCVSKVIMANDVSAWLTSRASDPCIFACTVYTTKVSAGARIDGVYPGERKIMIHKCIENLPID